MARLRTLLTLLAAVFMVGTLLGGPAWAATPSDGPTTTTGSNSGPSPEGLGATSGTATFGIQPAKAKTVDGRAGFSYAATAGAVVHDYVAVSNYSKTALSLHVYATDAYNTATGGYTLLPSTQKATDSGLWITLDETFVTLPSKTTAIIPFTLRVPKDASPGDHAGGIVASLTTMTHDAKGNQIAVESRVGTRVAVRVSGKLTFQLSVTKVSAVYHQSINPFGSGSATVSYVVTNTGDVRLIGTQAVTITSLFGGSEQSLPIPAIKELLPHDSMEVTTQVYNVTPSFAGTARVTVTPEPFPGDIDPPFTEAGGSATATAGLVAIPWPLIVLILIVLAAALFGWRRHRQGKMIKSAGSKGGPGGPGGPKRPVGSTKTTTPRPRPKVTAPAPTTKRAGVKSGTGVAAAGAKQGTAMPAAKTKTSAATAGQVPKPKPKPAQ